LTDYDLLLKFCSCTNITTSVQWNSVDDVIERWSEERARRKSSGK